MKDSYYRITEDIRRLYSLMNDEISQKLFIARLEYDITSETDTIETLMKYSAYSGKDELENIAEYLRHGDEVFLYTASDIGAIVVKMLKVKYNMYPTGFCDRDPYKQKQGFCGLPVIAPETLFKKHADSYIFIASITFEKEILNILLQNNIPCNHIINQHVGSRGLQYFEFMDNIDWNYCITRCGGGVIIDGGCYDCGTSIQFIKEISSRSKSIDFEIYAFEPDTSNHEKCKYIIQEQNLTNVKLIQAGLGEKPGTAHFKACGSGGSRVSAEGDCQIKLTSIDEVARNKNVIFIKMDIEGSELNALKGAELTIIQSRPVLAICVYHKPGDILAILEYLSKICPDYCFYLRHYGDFDQETVLYAIPQEMQKKGGTK